MISEKIKEFSTARTWKGRWIWADVQNNQENCYYYFRQDFKLNTVNNLKLLITADTRYKLYLNGSFVGEGSVQSQPYYKYYDIHQVDSYLRKGFNCIAVVVNFTGTMPDTRGGLLAELLNDSGEVLLKTDDSWQTKSAVAWQNDTFALWYNKVTTHQEFFDARKVPEGWNKYGFDTSSWRKSVILKDRYTDRPPAVGPWSRLIPRDIPFMVRKSVLPERIEKIEESIDLANRFRSEDLSIVLSTGGKPVKYSTVEDAANILKESGSTIIQNSTKHLDHVFDGIYDPCIILDFGKVITGHFELKMVGVEGGIVDIGYAERLIDGQFNNAIEGQFADRYIMTEGQQKYCSFTWKGFRFVKLRFHSCFKPVKIKSARTIISTYPYENKGKFDSDNKRLREIFKISRYTIRLCSNEFIMDTPWREQGQWLGDVSAVTLGAIYSCFGDTKLPAKFLRQSAANQHPTGLLDNVTNVVSKNWQSTIPDYSLWWIMAIWNHYLYTGEELWVHHYYPHIVKVIYTFLGYINDKGLLTDMSYWPLIDWADLDRRGESTTLNAMFYGTLKIVSKMAKLKNDEYMIELVKEVCQGIRDKFVKRFYSKDKGCFVDANIDGQLSSKVSEHANVSAIFWGLCNEKITKTIINNLYESEQISYTEAQPYFTTVVLQALDKVGRFDLALEIIEKRWGERMLDRGATSTYEEWGINGSWRNGEFKGFLRTLSHAWSAHPAEFLIKNLIGLKIVKPGCKEIDLSFRQVDFNYNVTYPTPLGPISVCKKGDQIKFNKPEEIVVNVRR